MEAIGLLMMEHRLTERMLRVMRSHAEHMREGHAPDDESVAATIDFIGTYIDRCHHGKEEDILFRGLSQKPLKKGHREIMEELMAEHDYARRLLAGMEAAFARYRRGERDALPDVASPLGELGGFYQSHIDKEDKRFFFPSMEYFTAEERAAMFAASREYDMKLFHSIYRETVEKCEKRLLLSHAAP